MKWKLAGSAFLAGLAANSAAASAHSRWFMANDPMPPAPPIHFDFTFAAMLLAVLFAVSFGLNLTRNGTSVAAMGRLLSFAPRTKSHIEWRLLSSALGVTLIVNSLHNVFVAPDLVLDPGLFGGSLAFLQALVGAMLVLNTRIALAAMVVMALPLACWLLYSFGQAIDYAFELFGIGAALVMVSPLLSADDRAWVGRNVKPFAPTFLSCGLDAATQEEADEVKAKAMAMLRIMLGVQLIVLAAHDKLLYPEVSLAFVNKYPFVNFPAALGLSGFSNLHFVIGCGFVETALGAMLVGNVATRVVCLILTSVFVLTGIIFGVGELFGHLPIAAAMVMLLIFSPQRAAGPAWRRGMDFQLFRLAGAAAAVLAGAAFLLDEPKSGAGAPALHAATVPGALYKRFSQLRQSGGPIQPELAQADDAVRTAIADAQAGRSVDKDELARRLFELSIRYEAAYGADVGSQWLRYAHLTAACTQNELAAFRATVGSSRWPDMMRRAPAELVAELMPIGEQAAEEIMQGRSSASGASIWQSAADAAPAEGRLYVNTHALAAIARIIETAAAEPQVWGGPKLARNEPGASVR